MCECVCVYVSVLCVWGGGGYMCLSVCVWGQKSIPGIYLNLSLPSLLTQCLFEARDL